MLSIAAFALASALAASATNITVVVGDNNGLVFNPNSVTAQPNDFISFQFQSKNHSVTQSTFAAPCVHSANGIDSGFMPVSPTGPTQPVWTIQVNDTTPLWFYCAQTNPANHCQAGMVFAVNPTADKSFQAFQTAAKGGAASASNGTSTGSVAGGASPSSPASGVAGTGAAAAPSGFATASGPVASASGSGSAAPVTTSSSSAVGLSSAGAFSLVSMFAAVAGFML